MTSKYIRSPSFCYIAPTAYLEQYATVSNTHLVLAHLVHTSPEYASFYKKLSERGDFIMMDNSAYELKTPYEPDMLIALAGKCGAHAVVLPDYPFQPSTVTIEAAIKYIPLFKQANLGTFFVPQSKSGDLEDWIHCYQWAANNNDVDIIGMSILGIPNALSMIDPSYARVVMTQLLLDRGVFAKDKHHHYLGLNAGPALEIPSLLRMNVLDTVDSSNPVWTAILGHAYTENADSYLQVVKPKMPVNFDIERTTDVATHDRIANNIEMTQSLFQSGKSIPVWYAVE